jgi:K+-sensing histidine kinase KdpD
MAAQVRQVSYVPDAGHRSLIELAHADPAIETTVLTAKDVAKAIADFAREHKVTQLFISHHSKAAQSLVNRARDMQVTVVAERRR